MNHPRLAPCALAVALGLTLPALAEYMMPNDAPVERLVRNVSRYVGEHPDDPEGH